MADYSAQFREVTRTQTIDQQAMTFLRSFVAEFSGNFEEVLELAEEFRSFANDTGSDSIQELDEFQAHRFLEQRGETKTVRHMREELASIDIDSNNHMAFIEYLLFKYHKTPEQLFTAKPNAVLLRKLEAAIAKYKAVFEEKKAKEARMAELEAQVAAGGPGANRAKAELRRMQMADPAEEAKNEMEALQQKLAAKRALRNPQEEEDRAFQEEQARLAEEERKKKEAAEREKNESRARLKARAALWQ